MKFNLTIKDNETGEIVRELDCNCIIGGAGFDNGDTAALAVVCCNSKTMMSTALAAEQAIDAVFKDEDPMARILYDSFKAFVKQRKENDNADVQN